jgi:lipopolysaccharide exporter
MADAKLHVGRSLLSGGIWMAALRWAIRGIGLINTVILARLLSPGDFGLIAMAMTVIGLVEVLGYAGQQMALIRHPEPTRAHYDSVWTLSILLSALLTLLLWAGAEPAALYFHEPRIVWLVRVLALRTLVGGFENVGVVAFRRDLRFDREFTYWFSQRVLSALVTVGFAFWLRDWRALAAGILGGRVLGVALSYVMQSYRPRLCFSRIREVLAFSGWMLTVNIAQYVNDKADELAVGSMGSPASMGLYNVAADTATAPTAETVLPVLRALFPVFARIRDDPAALRSAYLDVLSVSCILSVAIGGGMALVAGDFVQIVLGAKWLAIVPLMRVLAIAGGLFAIMQNAIPVLTAIGHERLAAQLTVSRAVSLLLAVGAAAVFGDIMAIAYARVAITLVFIPGIFLTLARVLPITLGDMLARIWRPLAAGAVMAACVLAVHATAPGIPVLRLAIDMATGAAAYIGATLLLWRLAGLPAGPEAAAVSWVLARPVLGRMRAWP